MEEEDDEFKNTYRGPERRRISLSERQIDAIAKRVEDRIYIQVGKRVVRVLFALAGAGVLAALGWKHAAKVMIELFGMMG